MPDKDTPPERLQALRQENRNLRFLRFLVDLALMEIRAGSFTLDEAEKVMENVRSQALQLFPGKETAFDWIYRPRFRRAITETFKLH
ncbi:MAG: hypothetical protein HY790_01860 [Deltaproteobacteria bacterium]|nr:hypothetical protein [Deltaproteobacteria bacterium]MBI4794584.1 hypothetical protein [Deltaproteobacteria bacterium]